MKGSSLFAKLLVGSIPSNKFLCREGVKLHAGSLTLDFLSQMIKESGLEVTLCL